MRQLVEARTFAEGASKAGSAVSGLVLLQVILLGLLGANNSAREIAGERAIYEKERFAGLSPAAYVASKASFLAVLVLLVVVVAVSRELAPATTSFQMLLLDERM